jgi:hypothetical protein
MQPLAQLFRYSYTVATLFVTFNTLKVNKVVLLRQTSSLVFRYSLTHTHTHTHTVAFCLRRPKCQRIRFHRYHWHHHNHQYYHDFNHKFKNLNHNHHCHQQHHYNNHQHRHFTRTSHRHILRCRPGGSKRRCLCPPTLTLIILATMNHQPPNHHSMQTL